MSWLSKLTHTEGLTPDWLKAAGDKVAPFVVNSIPGGNVLNGVLNLTNQGNRPATSLSDLVAQTGQNMATGINTAANLGAAKAQGDNIVAALSSPLGLGLIAVVVYLVARKKS